MKITSLLANHVEAVNNLLYVSGAGIDRATVPAGVAPPYAVSLGIGLLLRVPWQSTNQEHRVTVDLADADGHPVELEMAPGQYAPFQASMQFTVGRPPNLAVGEEQTVALAVGLPNFPFPRLGQYQFTISISGSAEDYLPFRVTSEAPPRVGSGPTALPI